MPYRKPKNAYALPIVTLLAISAPLGVLALGDTRDIKTAGGSKLTAIPAEMAEVTLGSAPDAVLPLRELTGLNLPDLHLSDLRMLPLPASIPLPPNLPAPPGIRLPSEIPLPRFDRNAPGFIAEPGPETPPAAPADPAVSPPAAPEASAPSGESAPAALPASEPAQPAVLPEPAQPAVLPEPAQPAALPEPAQPAATPAPADGPEFVPGLTGDPATPALDRGAVPDDLIDKVGAQVKELTRETPFSMVALTAPSLDGTTVKFRAQRPDGTWGPWYGADQETGTDRAVPGRRAGTEPIYVGSTKKVQVLTTRKQVAAPADAAALDHNSSDPAQIDFDKLAAVLIDPSRGNLDENLSSVAAPLPGGGPKVISRAQWGADESLRCQEPTYDDGVAAITVHHTAGRNDYSKSESAGIVRAIYTYHAKTLGWCDIGYNALVDKYGQIFEGRYGGLDKPVEGAHAGGFNENTAGVAVMGDYDEATPTDVSVRALGQYIGWRAKVAGFDPEGSTTMYSEGSDYTKYPLGQAVVLPNVFAHRDVGNTECPGDNLYAIMDRIRQIAEDAANGTDLTIDDQKPRTDPQRNAGYSPPQDTPDGSEDLAALAVDLTNQLLAMLDHSAVARYWNDQGGSHGPLGQPTAAPVALPDGGQYGEFTNGFVYSTPTGQVFSVVGKILERFLQLGANSGVLGLPTSNEYPVPDGIRADFRNGALIFNRITGIVTTVLNEYGPVRNPAPGATEPVPGKAIPLPLGSHPAQGAPAPGDGPAQALPTPEAPAGATPQSAPGGPAA